LQNLIEMIGLLRWGVGFPRHQGWRQQRALAAVEAPALEVQRRGMTDYNFAAQYRQNPQPLAGNLVKRDWLRYCGPFLFGVRLKRVVR
jgi:hypothetical protein